MIRHRGMFLILMLALPPAAKGEEAATLTHGPMLGRQSATSMGIWGRTSRAAALRFRYGISADKLDMHSPAVKTSAAHDFAGHVVLSDLKPDTRYYYRAEVDGQPSGLAGSFRTLRDAKALIDPKLNPRGLFNFRFEFACGNNQDRKNGVGPTMPTYTTMLRTIRDKVDFAILNGDWLYEEDRDYPVSKWRVQTGIGQGKLPREVELVPALAGVWENYKTYLGRPKNLAEWHRHVPSYFTFDDHELLNDVYGCGEIGRRDRRAVFRDVGVRAWFDYLGWSNPVEYPAPVHFGQAELSAGGDVLVDRKADFTKLKFDERANLHIHWGTPHAGLPDLEFDREQSGPNSGVYEVVEVLDRQRLKIRPAARAAGKATYSIGRRSYGKFRVANCDFYLLDTRSHRQMHDVRNPAKRGLTMLGRHQTAWLIDQMKNSDADFFFVVSSVNFMIPHIGGGGAQFDVQNKDEAWTVFLEEREKLIEFWDSLGRPVFVLTGDLHNSFAIKVTDRVWEFASGPHNSVNHRGLDEGDRPVNGRYQYGPRPCEIRWSTTCLADIPRSERLIPTYCVVQVNNVFNNPLKVGQTRLVAYPAPQVVFQYFNGRNGDLRYAEAISLTAASPLIKRAWSERPPGEKK